MYSNVLKTMKGYGRRHAPPKGFFSCQAADWMDI